MHPSHCITPQNFCLIPKSNLSTSSPKKAPAGRHLTGFFLFMASVSRAVTPLILSERERSNTKSRNTHDANSPMITTFLTQSLGFCNAMKMELSNLSITGECRSFQGLLPRLGNLRIYSLKLSIDICTNHQTGAKIFLVGAVRAGRESQALIFDLMKDLDSI